MANKKKSVASKADQVIIYSTMSRSTAIQLYNDKGENKRQLNTIKGSVTINGGANIAGSTIVKNKVLSSKGAVTYLTREEYNLIKEDFSFKRFIKRGFITVDEKGELTLDKAVADMTKKDGSVQKTEKDYPNERKLDS